MSPLRTSFCPSIVLLGCFFLIACFIKTTSAAGCSGTVLCPSGCCSRCGFCGFSSDHCGAGCLSTCDAVPPEITAPSGGGECNATVPCKVGCCSKFGFCGTTDELYGEDDAFDRPSCGRDHRIERVIGYYEQWSLERPCNRVSPEAIPAGYYTHINFAFAGIDPRTFEILGPAEGDHNLWKRIQSLRLDQPSVEIWIALGGWVFNDADQPTKTTFSDIVRSETNQKAFAKSLLSMMGKYGFDGVDINWNHPVAEERSGRKEDYKNFPRWMKNLRSQLHSSGKRYGLSLTLPASYLQHFDIKCLEQSVDWFNVMSYDMHGTWDMNNRWVGAYLNSHTNLTEIKNCMDILWRNDVDPSKVVMGMAYYGRSFTLANPACTEPGCIYRSGGNAGECSGTIVFLLNSEIQDTIDRLGLTPTLYEKDAVKVVAFNDQWVSFDDEETFKIRGDYVRSQCMGGVMVWAISHDDRNHTSAKALTNGIGRKRMAFPNYPEPPSSSLVSSTQERQESSAMGGSSCSGSICGEKYQEEVVEACRWVNCGEDCSAGWKWIDREDSNLKMTDETFCLRGNRKFCCPGDFELPQCQWRGIPSDGGIPGPSCNDGEVEVGTLSKFCDLCHTSACCTITKSTEPYASSGEDASCPSDYSIFLFGSSDNTTTLDCISDTHYTTQAGDTCDSIAKAKSVSAGTLYAINPTIIDCISIPAGLSLCLPQTCKTAQVTPSDTCISLGVTYGASWRSIVDWNGALDYGCTNLVNPSPFWGETICVSAPGDSYVFKVGNGSIGETPHLSYSGDTPIDPPADAVVAPNTTTNCGVWYTATDSLTCEEITIKYAVTADRFIAYNPSLNAGNCTASLQEGLTYCALATWGWDYDEEDNIPWDEWVDVEVPMAVSTDGSCGIDTTCLGSTFGNCCVATKCGGSEELCMAENCNSFYGGCGEEYVSSKSTAASASSSSSSSALPSSSE